jgi:flagellar P-ring protein precursor FlgI
MLARLLPVGLLLIIALASSSPLRAELRIKHICRLKGQEENTLQGIGIVVGLKGTGDSEVSPTLRALARAMQHMGNSVAAGAKGDLNLLELKNAKNVALVFVTVTVPAQGARQGTQLNCAVNAISAKSLDGGYLLSTALVGPIPGDSRVFAFAQGPITVEDPTKPAAASIHGGCRLEADFDNKFIKDNKITLVIDKNHASFAMAQEIEQTINNIRSRQESRSPGAVGAASSVRTVAANVARAPTQWARALNQGNVEVQIPSYELNNPVSFIGMILDEPLINRHSNPRVVINERTGAIVVGADVEIGPVVVKHKSFVVETGGASSTAPWVPVDATNTTLATTKLKNLVDALNALKAPSEDVIEIIKTLDASGHLYGQVVIE